MRPMKYIVILKHYQIEHYGQNLYNASKLTNFDYVEINFVGVR